MAEEKTLCGKPGCGAEIQVATARRNGGLCGPCAGRKKAAEWKEYVEKNRRVVDPYVGVTDPVELLMLIHEERQSDPLIQWAKPPRGVEELCRGLSRPEADRLIARLIEEGSGRNEVIRLARRLVARVTQPDGETRPDREIDLTRCLAAFTEYSLDALLENWAESALFYPGLAYRGAGAGVRDQVLTRLGVNKMHALRAAAWIGDEVVVEEFRRLARYGVMRPESRYTPGAEATHEAGWEICEGKRRELTLPKAYGLKTAGEVPAEAIWIGEQKEEVCPWCGNGLRSIIRTTSTELLSVLGLATEMLEIVTCELCACYGEVFGELDSEGRGGWSRHNKKSSEHQRVGELGENPWRGIGIQSERRGIYHSADVFLPTTYTQFGGLPGWVQGAAYPTCRGCHRTMVFVAQVDLGDRGEEGVYYAFLCKECRLTGSCYQQT